MINLWALHFGDEFILMNAKLFIFLNFKIKKFIKLISSFKAVDKLAQINFYFSKMNEPNKEFS